MTRPYRSLAALPLLAALVLAACAPRTDLQPAPSANEVDALAQAARTSVDGVEMTAQADPWPGPEPIKTEVTPVRLVIENNSTMPLRVRYSELALVGPDGTRYAALPPYQVEGSVAEPVLVDGYDPVAAPAFTYSSFEVAPLYDPVYGINTYAGPYAYDYGYYDTYGSYYVDASLELPTEAMLARALPEGVLNEGGSVDGYVYFERVPADMPRVTFRADLVAADSGREFGEIRIPFTVE